MPLDKVKVKDKVKKSGSCMVAGPQSVMRGRGSSQFLQ